MSSPSEDSACFLSENPAPNTADTRDSHMVVGIRSSLIQKAHGLAIQCHKLALEPNVAKLGDVLFAGTPIIFHKDRDRRGCVPVRAIERQIEDVRAGNRLRDFNGLGRGELGGG